MMQDSVRNSVNKPSIRIAGEVDDRSIDQYELVSARRALKLLKSKLGSQLQDLIRAEVSAGNAVFRDHVARSGGRTETGTIKIEASNLTVARFSGWLGGAFTRQDVLIDAQPEQYLLDMTDPRGPHIVETLGEHVVSFYMSGWDNAREETDGDRRRSTLTLEDGTVLGAVSTAFLDTETGMMAELSVTLPATAAEAVQQHLQHFSVEFRSWMLMAAEGK